MSESRKPDDAALIAAISAFQNQANGTPGKAFSEDGDTRPDQYFIEGSFHLTPIIDAISTALQRASSNRPK